MREKENNNIMMALSQNTWMIVETLSLFCQLKFTLKIVTKTLCCLWTHLLNCWQHRNKKENISTHNLSNL